MTKPKSPNRKTVQAVNLAAPLRRRPLNTHLFQHSEAMIRLPGFVTFKQAMIIVLFGALVGDQANGLRLPLDRGGEVAGLGVGGREGGQAVGDLPFGELAGTGRRDDRLLAIPNFGVGAGRQDPGPPLLCLGVVGLEADRSVQVRKGSIEVRFLKPDARRTRRRLADAGSR